MRSVLGWLKSASAGWASISFSGKQRQLTGACVNCYSRRTRCLTSHRSMVDRFTKIAASLVVAVATSAYGSAGVIINFSQVGQDVVATVSGSLPNLSGRFETTYRPNFTAVTWATGSNLLLISPSSGQSNTYALTRTFGSFVAWS